MKTCFSFIIAIMLCLTGIAQAAANRPIAALREVKGIVKLVRAESKSNSLANPGALLYPGDELNTGGGAYAAVLFVDGSLVKLQENSSVTLQAERTESGALDTRMKLPLGKIWAKVTRRDSKFEVETPSSVASVKGTELAVWVAGDGTSTLFVFMGIVEFSNPLGKVTVRQNQKSEARPEEAPAPPKKMTSKEQKAREPEMGASWQLEMKSSNENPTAGEQYRIKISALDAKTGKQDPVCGASVIVASNSEEHSFSLYGVEWTPQIEAPLIGGGLNFYGKSDEPGQVQLTAQANECRPHKIDISFAEQQQQAPPEGDWESEAVFTILRNLGITDAENMGYVGGQITQGESAFDYTLRQLLDGGMEVEGFEIIEMPNGYKKIVLRIKQ